MFTQILLQLAHIKVLMEKVLLEETLINIYQRGYRRLNIAELNKYLDELNLICFDSFFVSVNAFCYFQPNWFSF